MKSKIGISTWSLQQLSYTQGKTIDDLISIVADMGVDGIDICEEYIPCHPDVNLVELRRIRKLAEKNNLQIGASWFCSEILSGIHASSEERVLEVFKKNIAIASEMGAKFICIPMLLNVPGQTIPEATATFIRFLEKVLPYAEKYDMPIAHEIPRQYTPQIALDINKALQSKYYTICPDLETWRLDTEDLPLGAHCENINAGKPEPEPIESFLACLPYSPYVHFKLLSLDEQGEEPHFPIQAMMEGINNSDLEHYLCIEYEGWIPDIHPDRDPIKETGRCVELIRRYQR
jgi:hypothetical protein